MKFKFAILSLIVALLPLAAAAQNVVSFKLPNGLTVYVCEDQTQHDVFGEVVVRTGSYNDPAQYTGLAHYLEHVMFKGTQKIGALDWEKEKPLYEQIVAKYDEMAATDDEGRKAAISKEINELTVQEGEVSLSQEYSNLIESIGGNGLNAGTSYDYTIYHNSFPANQLAKWMAVSSERFINPVFRAFQSELETVYEEYNMYSDDPQSLARNFLFAKAFAGSPYERDVIGLGEHLKNPRLSQLIKYYNDWYVPGNMALIIAGNVSAQMVKRYAMGTFGRLQPGTAPQVAEYPGFNVKGRVAYTSKFSYFPSTCLVFDGVKGGDEDEYALTICTQLLSNGSSTGALDRLTLSGDVMAAEADLLNFTNQGRVVLEAIPYYDEAQQSYDSGKKVENYLLKAVKSIIDGQFSQEVFDAVKVSLCRDFDLSMESNEGKANALAQLFVEGFGPDELARIKDRINGVTVDDVKRVAAKYLQNNYIVINNEIGTPDRKRKIKKPGYDPIKPPVGQSSEYARWFKLMQSPDPSLSFVDWSKVTQKQINSYSKLYYSKNESNDIYSLTIKYGANSDIFPQLEVAAELMNSAGIMAQYPFDKVKELFGQLGTTYYISADDEYLYFTMRGYESTLQESCSLLTKMILMPSLDEKQLNNLKGSMISSRMRRMKNVNVLGSAMNEYVLYGDGSTYRKEITDKDISDLNISRLTGDVIKASNYAAEIHYSGRRDFDDVYNILSKNLPLLEGEKPSTSPLVRKMQDYSENTVFFVPNTEAQQAQIYFYVPMGDYDRKDDVRRIAFNQYFSGGFNGLVMQEIREKNSMAYTAYGQVRSRRLPSSKEYFNGYVGTQNDKALGAIDLYVKLLTEMPQNPESIANIKSYIKETLLSQQPGPRSVSAVISEQEKQGYSDDPSKEWVGQVETLSFEDIVAYYNEKVKGRPVIIGVVGNPKDISAKELGKYGKVIRMNGSQLFNENDVLFQ